MKVEPDRFLQLSQFESRTLAEDGEWVFLAGPRCIFVWTENHLLADRARMWLKKPPLELQLQCTRCNESIDVLRQRVIALVAVFEEIADGKASIQLSTDLVFE